MIFGRSADFGVEPVELIHRARDDITSDGWFCNAIMTMSWISKL